MDIKNEVLVRIYIILFGIIVPISVLLLYRTIQIGILEGDYWRGKGEQRYIQLRTVEAERGNIMAEDGSLLATSIPFFDIYFDPLAASDEDFHYHVDSLAQSLNQYIGQYTAGKYRELLMQWRAGKKRFIPLVRGISYSQKQMLEELPLFELGQFRGGFIARKKNGREYPFGRLAFRSIGYSRGEYKIGLEGRFDEVLGGVPGQQMMALVDKGNNIWMPLQDLTQIEPQNGYDIVTTLDINLQDIAESALMRGVQAHDADWGAAIVMDVKTGAIKAIANLSKGKDEDGFFEVYNNAIGSRTEPGSTFKLASIMALLEDGYISLDDSVHLENGEKMFYEITMTDDNPLSRNLDSVTIKHAFEISSNVGIATLVDHYYGRENETVRWEGAARFIQRLKDFNLNLPTGIEIDGEVDPYIKEAGSEEDLWSGLTLPWMAHGYELQITPLQLLTFYNAVANNGTMMKPYLVSEIQHFGETKEVVKPLVIKKQIASPNTIEAAKELLEGVVENGTAYKLYTDEYRFAGKTGTAQIDYTRYSTYTRVGGYQASFVGYFPADKPIYSCIVVIYNPKQNGFYGGEVAGPVFREIADKAYATKIKLHAPLNNLPKPKLVSRQLPHMDIGHKEDIQQVLSQLNLRYYGQPETELGVIDSRTDSIKILNKSIPQDRVPSVVGMGLRDALYVLENRGLGVEISGFGKVVSQSILAGTMINGQTIKLTLD